MITAKNIREVAKCFLLVVAVAVLAVMTKNCEGPEPEPELMRINIEGEGPITVDQNGKVVGHDDREVPGP